MNVLDLFSGIGGFSLGLERAGMRTVAFCEIDPYARQVLAQHWPGVPCYGDVRDLTAERLARDGIAVDVICGGFPCQDISYAGKGAGLDGERSGLWSEIARLVGELRPRFVIVENVSALLTRGLGRVLGDLAALGYDAEWHCIPASYVGAPHRRDRVWIIAYPQHSRLEGLAGDVAHRAEWQKQDGPTSAASLRGNVADAQGERLEGRARAADEKQAGGLRLFPAGSGEFIRGENWTTEPDVGRVAHGIPARVDRLKCLGNAVVPQIPEIIGRAIMTLDGN